MGRGWVVTFNVVVVAALPVIVTGLVVNVAVMVEVAGEMLVLMEIESAYVAPLPVPQFTPPGMQGESEMTYPGGEFPAVTVCDAGDGAGRKAKSVTGTLAEVQA